MEIILVANLILSSLTAEGNRCEMYNFEHQSMYAIRVDCEDTARAAWTSTLIREDGQVFLVEGKIL